MSNVISLMPDDELAPVIAGLPAALAGSRILSERQAANFLDLSEGTLERMRKAGRAPRHVLLSERRLGYRISDLVAFVDSRAVDPKTAA